MDEIKEIIKYEGNNKHFFALASNGKNKYYLIYGAVNTISIESKRGSDFFDLCNGNESTITERSIKIVIDLALQHHSAFKIILLNSKEEYEHVVAVVKELI